MSKTVCVLGDDHLAKVATAGFRQLGYYTVGPELVNEAIWIVVAHDTPILENGDIDLTPIDHALQNIAPRMSAYAVVVVLSQVRVETCAALEDMVRALRPDWRSGVVYVPENLKLTDSIERFLHPDMLVFGSDNARALRSAFRLFETWECPKLTMSLVSAEMVKHAINGWLALNIHYANDIAMLSRLVGADEIAVANAMRMDKRMERAPLRPGPTYPVQGTLGRDVRTLHLLCERFGLEPCVK